MIQDDVSTQARAYWSARLSVDGALWDSDFLLLDRLLAIQEQSDVTGDLLEIGAYLGKSAILLGLHARSDEHVIVCDPFHEASIDDANARENEASYQRLTRRAFEANYGRYVGAQPRVIQELSTHIRSHVADTTLRLTHIDGGHLYNVVRADIENVQPLMQDDGVVVLDDFRAVHTPGVAAAVWEAVSTRGLVPFCLSEQKLYATWSADTAKELHDSLLGWVARHPEVRHGTQQIAGADVLIVANMNIPTRRSRVKSLIPPALTARLSKQPLPHLGE